MSRFAVGLDMSVHSSGCAIHDRENNKWLMCAFAQNAKEEGFYFESSRTSITLFPQIPKAATSLVDDIMRYIHIRQYFVEFLCKHIPLHLRANPHTCVNVEAYAYPKPEEAGYSSKLHESCGIVKCTLFEQGFLWLVPIVCTSWKADVIGHGKANKLDVLKFMNINGPCFGDLLQMFGYDEATLRIDHKDGSKVVPCPCQDLCDAAALAKKVYTPKKNTSTKKKMGAAIINEQKTEDPIIIIKQKHLPAHKVCLKRRKLFVPKQSPFIQKTQDSATSFWAKSK